MLVHCLAGISRSATICIAYLMYAGRVSLDTAHDYLKHRRPLIAPNLNFMRQLAEFESQLAQPTCPLRSIDGQLRAAVNDAVARYDIPRAAGANDGGHVVRYLTAKATAAAETGMALSRRFGSAHSPIRSASSTDTVFMSTSSSPPPSLSKTVGQHVMVRCSSEGGGGLAAAVKRTWNNGIAEGGARKRRPLFLAESDQGLSSSSSAGGKVALLGAAASAILHPPPTPCLKKSFAFDFSSVAAMMMIGGAAGGSPTMCHSPLLSPS